MSIVTADDVKTAAKNYKVGILLQNDTTLESMITLCQADLERRTGRIFEEREVVEKKIRLNTKLIQLDHYPVKTIDTLLLDGSLYTLDDEELEEATGTILLSQRPVNDYTATITYTTATPTNAVIAKDVLCRMVLDRVKNRDSTVEQEIKSLQTNLIGAI
jgi:gamma-glutamylcyclotransferase (GGCT)/AIG2-like uncharacterized protein YtfP